MIKLEPNKDLSLCSTLACPSTAQCYFELSYKDDIPFVVASTKELGLPLLVLGGGSNLVLTPKINSVVVRNTIKGIEQLSKTDKNVTLRVGAGENWHKFVTWCVAQNYSGLENLALIPGTMGAAPVQNIGAYGVEIATLVTQVNAYDLVEEKFICIPNEECQFRYRDSLFKDHEGRYVITSVELKLNRELKPNLSYGPLKILEQNEHLTVKHIYEAVIAIRTEKLPDPKVIPNAGSFFKNPILSTAQFKGVLELFPDLVHYPAGDQVKLAAGWLIDQAGLKGRVNDQGVGCYEKQALVVVNPKRANGDAILDWAETVKQRVFEHFGVHLEMEPRIWR
ncbi:UDP-N-acetylmuramate dehydrogenase [Reinekea sp.]|jgi:UDP-N-acetylmuramate dehydrogenase|uniref:UDP-N-acetylmuramate dehydrogenase n=1 Tax=Reinekea sp. TaxID=1970455 RepID=UPI003989E76E